jgi:hypothetical protein
MADTPNLTEATEASPTATDLVVDRWFLETFHNHGPALPVELFNHFRAATARLKERLNAALTTKED